MKIITIEKNILYFNENKSMFRNIFFKSPDKMLNYYNNSMEKNWLNSKPYIKMLDYADLYLALL